MKINEYKKLEYRRRRDILRFENGTVKKAQAKAKGATVLEDISLGDLYERDKGICGICKEHVPLGVEPRSPLSPSMDHKTKVTEGGQHTWENIQLAHLTCNQRKS